MTWDQVAIRWITTIWLRKRDKQSRKVIQVNDLEIYFSPTGKTRVYRKNRYGDSIELIPKYTVVASSRPRVPTSSIDGSRFGVS